MDTLKSLLKRLITVATLSFVVSCASTDSEAPTAAGDIDYHGSDCILIRTIRDYSLLDDQNLLIWGPGKRAYFVTLFRPSFELRSSFQLGFDSRDDQLCPFGGDGIVVGSLHQESIGIQSISRVSEEQAEQLLIRYGRKEPAEQQAPPPKDVEGAEVEELG
jgi:hypothetical protein